MLCASCKFLNKNEEAEFLFDKILRDEAKISSLLFLQNLATVIFRNSITNENRDRALIYLQKIHIAKPGWLLLLTLFDSVYNNETKTIWQTRYEKCLKAFPSLYNKMRLIELWNLPKEKEFHALYALLRGNPLSRFLFRLAFDSSKGDPNLHKEVISYARSKSKDTIYYAAQEVASECLGVTRTGDDTDGEALLAKIEALLKKAPHHQTLIYNKIFLITYLMRYQEAINEIKLYIGLFGYTNAIVNFIDSYANVLGDVSLHIEALEKGYKRSLDITHYEALRTLYKEHKNPVDLIHYLITHIFTQKPVNLDFYFDDIKACLIDMEDKSEGHALIDLVPRSRENLPFIAMRCAYYLDINPLMSLKDVEFVLKTSPTPEAKRMHIQVLARCGKAVEAAEAYVAYKIDTPIEIVESIIHNLFLNGEYRAIEEICKRTKLKFSCAVKKCIGLAYRHVNNHHMALTIYKELIQDEPNKEEHYLNKAKCYEALSQFGTAMDTAKEALALFPDSERISLYIADFEEIEIGPAPVPPVETKKTMPARPIEPNRVPYLVHETKKKERNRVDRDGLKTEKRAQHLQASSTKAVDPLADPLAEIKAIARKGEKETGMRPLTAAPAPAPVKAPPPEPPKPIVKLKPSRWSVGALNKALDVLKDVLAMRESLLSPALISRNYVYAILRLFTPFALNTLHPTLKSDLERIRNLVRHSPEHIPLAHLQKLFEHMRRMDLETQLRDWIQERGIITRIVLSNQLIITPKAALDARKKILAELEFILEERGEAATWKERIYHRNAIKAAVSTIGEASNFLPDALKATFFNWRTAGNRIAHQLADKVETDDATFVYEDDVNNEELWELISHAETQLKLLRDHE